MKEKAEWRLPALLKREGITPYRLHQKLAKLLGTSRTTVYRWANELPDSLNVTLLMGVITVLRDETGQQFEVSDLIAYKEE